MWSGTLSGSSSSDSGRNWYEAFLLAGIHKQGQGCQHGAVRDGRRGGVGGPGRVGDGGGGVGLAGDELQQRLRRPARDVHLPTVAASPHHTAHDTRGVSLFARSCPCLIWRLRAIGRPANAPADLPCLDEGRHPSRVQPPIGPQPLRRAHQHLREPPTHIRLRPRPATQATPRHLRSRHVTSHHIRHATTPHLGSEGGVEGPCQWGGGAGQRRLRQRQRRLEREAGGQGRGGQRRPNRRGGVQGHANTGTAAATGAGGAQAQAQAQAQAATQVPIKSRRPRVRVARGRARRRRRALHTPAAGLDSGDRQRRRGSGQVPVQAAGSQARVDAGHSHLVGVGVGVVSRGVGAGGGAKVEVAPRGLRLRLLGRGQGGGAGAGPALASAGLRRALQALAQAAVAREAAVALHLLASHSHMSRLASPRHATPILGIYIYTLPARQALHECLRLMAGELEFVMPLPKPLPGGSKAAGSRSREEWDWGGGAGDWGGGASTHGATRPKLHTHQGEGEGHDGPGASSACTRKRHRTELRQAGLRAPRIVEAGGCRQSQAPLQLGQTTP
jgi:hypothetical protein